MDMDGVSAAGAAGASSASAAGGAPGDPSTETGAADARAAGNDSMDVEGGAPAATNMASAAGGAAPELSPLQQIASQLGIRTDMSEQQLQIRFAQSLHQPLQDASAAADAQSASRAASRDAVAGGGDREDRVEPEQQADQLAHPFTKEQGLPRNNPEHAPKTYKLFSVGDEVVLFGGIKRTITVDMHSLLRSADNTLASIPNRLLFVARQLIANIVLGNMVICKWKERIITDQSSNEVRQSLMTCSLLLVAPAANYNVPPACFRLHY